MRFFHCFYFLSFLMMFSCCGSKESTNPSTKKTTPMDINSIVYTTFTRGYKDQTIVNKEEIEYQVLVGEKENIKRHLNKEQWQEILSSLEKIEVKNLADYEAPSTESYSDKGLAAQITIVQNGNSFSSVQFDKANPPKEFQPLINTLNSLIKKQ